MRPRCATDPPQGKGRETGHRRAGRGRQCHRPDGGAEEKPEAKGGNGHSTKRRPRS